MESIYDMEDLLNTSIEIFESIIESNCPDIAFIHFYKEKTKVDIDNYREIISNNNDKKTIKILSDLLQKNLELVQEYIRVQKGFTNQTRTKTYSISTYIGISFIDTNMYYSGNKLKVDIEHLETENNRIYDKDYFSYDFVTWVRKIHKINNFIENRILKDRHNPPPKQPLSFTELFKPEFQSKINLLFERLQLNGFTDENNEWIINANNLNEPAKLFYYLKDNKVLKYTKFAPAIKCFYSEFGCEVVEKANGNPRACTRINLLIQSDKETEKIYNLFLLSLINQK